ncbi:hypothetical protein BDF21DRAFT_490119 [Thamnidium elegans]|nr:hypothetical protein BDF21DRAFT_490119 [Thamnidium elegans]
MSRRIKKRVPLVIVHDSSGSSDSDREPVTATEPYPVSSIYFDSDPDNMSLSSEHVDPAQLTPPVESTTRESTTTDQYTVPSNNAAVDSVSKYCLSKQGRLYCNFNPSVTNNRGCQTNFANNELSKLVSHLNTFHGCNIPGQQRYDDDEDDKSESSIDKFYSPFNLSEDYPSRSLALTGTITTETDTELYKDNDDSDLYLDNALNSFLNLDPDNNNVSSTVEKQSFIALQQDNTPCSNTITESTTISLNTTQSTTISLSQLEYRQSTASLPTIAANTAQPTTAQPTTAQPTTTQPIPKPRKTKRALLSRVTPKVLRSATRQSELEEEGSKKPNTNKRKSAPEEPKIQPSPKRKLLPRPEKKTGPKPTAVGLGNEPSSPSYNTTSSESMPELLKTVNELKIIQHYPEVSVSNQQQSSLKKNVKDHHTYTSAEEQAGTSVSIDKQPDTTVPDGEQNSVAARRESTEPGTEAQQVIPSIPTDGLWPFEFGYGFFMKHKYHCNVTRSLGFNGCKKTFANRSVFIQHLHHAHHLNASNAMSSRESEEDNLHEKIVDMLISTSLPCSFVNNKKFLDMVKAIQETSAGQHIIPSLQETEKLMQTKFENRQKQIKSLLREQDHISLSVHTFHPLHHAEDAVVVITAFFIDTDWRIKELVIQFKTLPNADDLNTAIESTFIETVQQFDIARKVYLIMSPDFPSLDTQACKIEPIKFQISADISKPVVMPCLDQVIQLCKSCLCRNVEMLFDPLYKINSFKTKTLIYSWRGDESVDISKIVNFSKGSFSNSMDLLKEFMKITEEYNSVCFLNKKYASDSICHDEIVKIEKLLKAVMTLDESYEWLIEATNQRYPATNKILLIYMEILYILYQLAQCYGCKEESDILYEKWYSPKRSERGMTDNINNAYAVVIKYRILMEGTTENPAWQATISDPFSFSLYNARKKYYAMPTEMTPSLLASVINDNEHMISSIDSQAIELKSYISNRKKLDIFAQLEVTDQSEKSSPSDVDSISDFKDMLQVFISSSESNLQIEPENNNTMLTHFLNHTQNNFGLLNFWKEAGSNVYSHISDLTKQCFAVPITSFECLHMAEEAEDYYSGITYLYPKATTEENQRRTLSYMWQKYIDF